MAGACLFVIVAETMRADSINNPEHWRKRAEEICLLADEISDENIKQTMLRIVADYDRLSQRAEQRAHGFRPAWSGETFGLSNEPRSVRPVAAALVAAQVTP